MQAMKQFMEYLRKNGWSAGQNRLANYEPDTIFYKRFDTPSRDRLNDEKEGQQIICNLWYMGKHGNPNFVGAAYELVLRGELPDGTCISILRYGLPDTMEGVLERICKEMLDMWEYAVTRHRP